MQKYQSHRLLMLLILIPPLAITCLCGGFVALGSVGFLRSSSFPDYLWSLRITKELSNKGYPIHEVSVSGSEPPGFRIIDIQIGRLVNGEQQRTYALVKTVHEIVVDTFTNPFSQSDLVDVIVITIFDYSGGSYIVGIDFDTAHKYQLGEISKESYFEHWSFPPNTPEIMPP